MDHRRPSSYKSSRPPSNRPSGPSCVICFKTQSIFSIGPCDHPVCYECSTTMRVLCDQKECPICRRIMTKVIFTKEVDLFKNLDTRQYSRYNKKYGIAFDDHSVENSFEQLMRCSCKKCYERPDFPVFEQLATHMERNHRLYACRICVKHLKIFPSQRRWYNNDELAKHEESGDPDNTSHRGHPECQFCRARYLDKDELYKHLRKEHFYCHFCDADGIQDYYMTYDWLRKHFFDKHFLCEEGNCINEQFTSVFRTSIDLQAHKAQNHSRELGKQGHKEARTLRLEFNLRPRHFPLVEPGRPNSYQPPHVDTYRSIQDPDNFNIDVRDTFDFPSLNGQHTTVLPCARTRKQNQSVNTRDLNSFPALGQEPAPPAKPQKQQAINNRMAAAAVLKKPVEPPRPKSKDSAVMGPRLPNQARDFPSLDGNQQQQQHPSGKNHNKDVSASTNSGGGSSWVSRPMTISGGQDEKKKIKKETAAIKKKIAEAPKVPGPSDFPNLNKKLEPSKSNLAKLGNKKKTSTVDNNGSKKTTPPSENSNNNGGSGGQNIKRNGVQTTVTENNNSPPKKAADNVIVKCTTDSSNKENSRPKSKCAETIQCNGDSSSRVGDKTSKSNNANAKTGTGSKKEVQSSSSGGKKKENGGKVQVPEKPEETMVDTSNPKDKKRKKEGNKEITRQPNQEDLQHHDSRSLVSTAVTPKIPPGFENTFQQQNTTNSIRAPPGLLTSGNRHPQTRIKAPPGLTLTTSVTNSSDSNRMFEYLHPVGSSVRNKMLINNLVAALIPARDDRFDTFERFKEMSTLFRKNVITAFDFYSYCVEALHPHHFEAVFLELVLLLPDIQKQQELLFIYNRNSREEMNVEVCGLCQQVLRTVDIEPHVTIHRETMNS